MNKLLVLMSVLGMSITTIAQSLDSLLASVERNNTTLRAARQLFETQSLQFSTGLTPANPKIEFDYLFGIPAASGNQSEFAVTQEIDFPTAFVHRSHVKRERVIQAESELAATRQRLLLEVKQTALVLVYHNKMQSTIENRKRATEKLAADFQTLLDKGEGTILDLNKARLRLVEISIQLNDNTSIIAQLTEKLNTFNGGVPITFTDTLYPVTAVPTLEELVASYERGDPSGYVVQQERTVAARQLALSKALTLPRIEAGYRSEVILDQTLSGLHTGITIPLWANRHTVKAQQAAMTLAELRWEDYQVQRSVTIRQQLARYNNLQRTVADYEALLTTTHADDLLTRALTLGQITAIEYFLEASFYFDAEDNYLLAERDMMLTGAELMKWML